MQLFFLHKELLALLVNLLQLEVCLLTQASALLQLFLSVIGHPPQLSNLTVLDINRFLSRFQFFLKRVNSALRSLNLIFKRADVWFYLTAAKILTPMKSKLLSVCLCSCHVRTSLPFLLLKMISSYLPKKSSHQPHIVCIFTHTHNMQKMSAIQAKSHYIIA